MIVRSIRWHKRQLEHYDGAVEGKTDPPRYKKFRDQYLGPPPLKVVDCGCAGGDITKELFDRGYEVIGLDFPEVIAKTEKKYPDLKNALISCNLNDEIPDIVFDFDWVYASEICEHITHDYEFLVSCYECLKPGGKVFVTVPRHADKWEGHLRFYPEESMRNLLWATGFEFVAVDKTFASLIVIGEKGID